VTSGSAAPPPKPYLALPPPWLVAHRGGGRIAPENTLAAFDAAARLGADAIETDVHLSADGDVYVFHDDETRALTGEPGTIERRTAAEIARLRVVARASPEVAAAYPPGAEGTGIPTLEEALGRYPRMRFNVEAKTPDPRLAEALVRVVVHAGAVDRVCLGSANDAQGRRIRALLPRACHFLPELAAACHVLGAKVGAGASACPPGYDVADLPMRQVGLEVITPRVLAHFRRLGVPVFVWTIDDEADMRRLLALGVHGIMTDRPDVLRRVLDAR
jgi:glycerophosphoryl diester phosphodiesterase